MVPFAWEKLKLLRDSWEVTPRNVLDVAPAHVASWFESAGRFRLSREEADLVAQQSPVEEPYWDVRLASDSALRAKFFGALSRKGLLTVRRKVHSFAGLFFVKKKGGQIRMVLDGRATNASHRLPPHVALGSVAAWSEIDLADVDRSQPLWKCSGDLQDSFYQFYSDQLAEDFAFDYPIKACEAGVSCIWEDGAWIPIEPNDTVYYCFRGIPMGWSWAMWVVQSIVENVLLHSAEPGNDQLVADRRPAARLQMGRPLAGGYVDNFLIVAACRDDAVRRYRAVLQGFAVLGIALHELREPCCDETFDYLGVEFANFGFLLRGQRQRAWRLYQAVLGFLELPKVSGKQLRCILGHLVHFFQLAPLALSLLGACYAFVQEHLEEAVGLWKRARLELWNIAGLIFLAEVDLQAEWLPWAICSDACEHSFAIHAKKFSSDLLREAGSVRERWRFTAQEKLPVASHTLSYSSAKPKTAGLSVAEKLFGDELAACRVIRKPPSSLAVSREVVEVDGGLVAPLASEFAAPSQWFLFLRGGWRYRATMHIKEALASLRGLAAVAQDSSRHGCQLLSLGDNLAEICACEKGRCSDAALRVLLSHALAFTLAPQIRWRRRYIESERNPSDADSRRLHRPGQRIAGVAHAAGGNFASWLGACSTHSEATSTTSTAVPAQASSRLVLPSLEGTPGSRGGRESAADDSPQACKPATRQPPGLLERRKARDGSIRWIPQRFSTNKLGASPSACKPPPGLLERRRAKDGTFRVVPGLFASSSADAPPGLARTSRGKDGSLRFAIHRSSEPAQHAKKETPARAGPRQHRHPWWPQPSTASVLSRRGKCGPRAASSPTGISNAPRAALPPVSEARRRGAANNRDGTFMLELFSGRGRLVGACAEKGLRIGPAFEIRDGRWFDLCDRKVLAIVRRWIKTGRIWYIHLGTPCSGFSVACSSKRGKSRHHSERCAAVTLQIVKLCRRHGVYWSVENPASSKLFAWQPFMAEGAKQSATYTVYDNCRYGTPWLKPTALCGTLPGMWQLGLRCNCCSRHVVLQGKVCCRVSRRQVWLTSLAAAYPPKLCRSWADVVLAAAPPSARRRPDDPILSSHWEADLRAACSCTGPSTARVPACPARFQLPWDPAGPRWGTSF